MESWETSPSFTPLATRRDSICLYMPSREVVIVGDALQYRSRRLGPPAASVTADSGQALESLKKLLPLEFEIICFSHFPPLKGDARGALRRMLE
jgi:glyoxylase-like metal-dependent hydrolase (beta-lactamase superfamily II)